MRGSLAIALAISAVSLTGTGAFLRVHLEETSARFADDFARQNKDALAAGDSFALASRLGSLSGGLHWVCIRAERGGQVFFERTDPRGCAGSLAREEAVIRAPTEPPITIRVTLALPPALERAAALFAALQLALLATLFFSTRAGARREESVRVAGEVELARLASQVAHDIRSPLAALAVVASRLGDAAGEDALLVRSAARRVHAIAEELLRRARQGRRSVKDSPTPTLATRLRSVVRAITREKRAIWGGEFEIRETLADEPLFAEIDSEELSRALSNLLNNARESGSPGAEIRLSREDGEVVLEILDSGRGIAPELLARLTEGESASGKAFGNGLGLSQARRAVESAGGSLAVESRVGVGTRVSLRLPSIAPPPETCLALESWPGMRVAVVDDDPSVGQLWRARFGRKAVVTAFASGEDWAASEDPRDFDLFLVDHDLERGSRTGLDWIEKHGIADLAVLVTSRADDPEVVAGVRRLGAKLLPKIEAAEIAIVERRAISCPSPSGTESRGGDPSTTPVASRPAATGQAPGGPTVPEAAPDAVLIDDDSLVRETWGLAARRSGRKLVTLRSASEMAGLRVARSTPIYVDAQLADGERGEESAVALARAGYSRIYLATGRDPSSFSLAVASALRGIVGKDPPF